VIRYDAVVAEAIGDGLPAARRPTDRRGVGPILDEFPGIVLYLVLQGQMFQRRMLSEVSNSGTLAVHAKLDELLKATRDARTELASIDESEPEVIEKIRDREKREAIASDAKVSR
jgi:hypothetical protein